MGSNRHQKKLQSLKVPPSNGPTRWFHKSAVKLANFCRRWFGVNRPDHLCKRLLSKCPDQDRTCKSWYRRVGGVQQSIREQPPSYFSRLARDVLKARLPRVGHCLD